MQYLRKNGMIDINDAIERGLIVFNEEERQGARKNKFWFNNYQWMYKEVDNDYGTYEEYSEVICYEIAKLLGIDCAEYDLATHNGKKGVITRSVVNSDEKIFSGTEVLNFVFEDYFVPRILLYENFIRLLDSYKIASYDDYEGLSDSDKNDFNKKIISFYNQSCFSIDEFIDVDNCNMKHLFEYCSELDDIYPRDFVEMKNGIIMSNNLYDIWYAIEVFCKISDYTIDIEKFMRDLTNMFIFDIIVSQGDRHADNWSVIVDKETGVVKLAALYDNSGALSLNRGKAVVNIDEFSKRLKIEKKPGKVKGLNKRMGETINHSFSGVKVSYEDVKNRNRNDEMIESFVFQSSLEFVDKLKDCIDLLSDENIDKIFTNIEFNSGIDVPDIVKNVTREVINYNIKRIKDKIFALRGDEYEYGKIQTTN